MAENRGIARPYADAAFELAREANVLGDWSNRLHIAAAVVGNGDVTRLIETPNTDKQAVVELIAGICRDAGAGSFTGSELDRLTNFLNLLAENGRLSILPEIAELFDKLKADVENSVDVVLTAATPVDPAQREKIVAALKRRFGREVNLHFQLDETLIGGARLQVDDLVIDGSVRTGLEKLSSALTN
jgi:F-type H+-transporting ATPase subunit delta